MDVFFASVLQRLYPEQKQIHKIEKNHRKNRK